MATKTYNIDINVNTKTLGQLENQLAEVNEELKQVDRNSEAFKNLTKQAQSLNKEILKTNKEIEGFTMEKKIDAANGAAMVFSGTLNTVVGGLGLLGVESEKFGEFEKKAASAIAAGIGIKDMVEGMSKVGPAFATAGKAALAFGKTTRGALIATGVGAFAVAIGLLVANWESVTKAAKKFADMISERFPAVGKLIDGISSLWGKVKEKVVDAAQAVGLAETDIEIAARKTKEATNDKIKSLEREIALGEQRGDDAVKLLALQEQLQLKRIELLKGEEDKVDELYAAETALMLLQMERKGLQLASQREEAEVATEINERGVAGIEKYGTALAIKTDLLTKEKLAQIQAKKASKEAAQQTIDQAEAEEERNSALGASAAAFSVLGDVVGRETAEGKALASASALINTYLGASQVIKDETLPTIAKIPAVAAIIAAGLTAVKKINEVQVPGGGGGVTSGGNISPTQIQDSVVAAEQQVPQIDPAQPMVQAYVVAGDTRSAAEAEAKIQTRRTFGS